jgi:FG-GAP repeat/FG-GAP-like repeat/Putative Ig domain
MPRSSLIHAVVLAFACATFVPGGVAAPAALPQQSGVVDLLSQAATRIDGPAGGNLAGYSVSGAGDVNGDGRPDVVVAARFASFNNRAQSGAAYVVFGGGSSTSIDLLSLGAGGFRIGGAAPGDYADAVAGVGDVNGDGRADVAVGSPNADSHGRAESGSAYVVFGKASTTPVDLAALGDGGFRIDGAAPSNFAGRSVAAAGDVNADGRPDVLVGAPLADHNGRDDSGTAYVVFGKASTAAVDLAALGPSGFRIDGAFGVDEAGDSVSGAGDVNRDGRQDVIVGAPGASGSGRPASGSAYVVFGKSSTTNVDLQLLGDGGFRIDGAATLEHTGDGVAGVGDVNGDGWPDVAVGATDASTSGRSDSGAAYIVFGKSTTELVDLAALGGNGFRIDGPAVNDEAGDPLAPAGDVNGDGRPDVLVGVPLADNNARPLSGSAYVVYGKSSPTAVDLAALGAGGFRIDGAVQVGGAGSAVAGAGDWNGDNRPDVLLGAPRADAVGRSGAGAAYVVLGFGQPRLAYDLLTATVGEAVVPHPPSLLERTGAPSFRASPALPAGLSLDSGGAVTGTPGAVYSQTHTVTMEDLVGTVSAPLAITIRAAPPAADTVAPRIVLRATSPQRAARQKRIIVRASCNEACRLSALGTITILGRRPVRVALRSASSPRLTAGQRTLSLVLSRPQLKRLSGFLAKGRRARANVTVRALDAAGNQRAATRAIVVRR